MSPCKRNNYHLATRGLLLFGTEFDSHTHTHTHPRARAVVHKAGGRGGRKTRRGVKETRPRGLKNQVGRKKRGLKNKVGGLKKQGGGLKNQGGGLKKQWPHIKNLKKPNIQYKDGTFRNSN